MRERVLTNVKAAVKVAMNLITLLHMQTLYIIKLCKNLKRIKTNINCVCGICIYKINGIVLNRNKIVVLTFIVEKVRQENLLKLKQRI